MTDSERLYQESAKMMFDSDYKVRFQAEYIQLKVRLDKLERMLENWSKGELKFEPASERTLFLYQYEAMRRYLDMLKMRAESEGIDLPSFT